MKKKILTLIIAICLLFPLGIGLLACGKEHVHNYSIYWTSDEDYHWHICLSDDCTETSEKFAHIWNSGEETLSPTCQREGIMTYTCVICGRTKTENISPCDHKYITINAKDATCEEDGIIEHEECEYCSKNKTEGNYIINKSHAWSDDIEYIWSEDNTKCIAKRTCTKDSNHIEEVEGIITSEIIQEKDCYHDEITVYTANFENSEFAETQIKNVTTSVSEGHNYVFVDEIQPTCTTYGFEEHYYCNKCGEYFDINKNKINESELHIPEINHDFNESEFVWGENHSTCTATRVCKNDTSHIETETVTTTSTIIEPPTCTYGKMKYIAVFTNPGFAKQEKIVNIEELGHDWIITYVWNEDHTQCTASRVCSRNPLHEIQREDNSETVYSTSVLKAPSTCTTNEIRTYTATFTNSYFEEQVEDFEIANTAHHTFVNHICSICGEADNDAVAKIGSGTSAIGYTTLEDSITYAQNGETITILKNISLEDAITINKEIHIDFNNKKITNNQNKGCFDIDGGKLYLNNGRLIGNRWVVWIENSGYLKVEENMILTCNSKDNNRATIAIQNDDSKMDIYGKVISEGNSPAISGIGNTGDAGVTINIYDGAEVEADNEIAIYFPNTEELNIYGGTITGKTAVYAKSGTINIKGGTFKGTGIHNRYSYNSNGGNATGDAIVIDACGYPGGDPEVNIEGGQFIVADESSSRIAVYNYNNHFATINSVYGYVLVVDVVVNETQLQNAVEKDNNFIMIYNNITISNPLTIEYNVEIDLNGKTITANNGAFIINKQDVQLVLHNGIFTSNTEAVMEDPSIIKGKITTTNTWLIKVMSGGLFVEKYVILENTNEEDESYVIGYVHGTEITNKGTINSGYCDETKEITE